MNSFSRIALVSSHPIQHFCPQYSSFSKNKEVVFKVFFGSALGLHKYIDSNFKTEISWDNLYLEEFDHTFLNGEIALPSNLNLDAISLEKELSCYNPEIVIIYGYFQRLQQRAYKWAIANNKITAYISDSELRQKRPLIKELSKFFFIRRYFSRIKFFLSVGDANEFFYKKYGVNDRQIIRMHFPIDLNLYTKSFACKEALRKQIRQRYNIQEDEIVVLVVGKLVRWKNQDHLIETMQLLEKFNIYVHLFIVGAGEMITPWQEKAKELGNSNVYFTGFVKTQELPAYYAASDIYVHPASIEPHSIAVSEAIYMGCPVIISDRCGSYGPSDDVQEGKNGFVYEFGNLSQLAQKIKILVADSSLRYRFSNYSHEIAVNFQRRAHFDVLTKLISSIAQCDNQRV